MAYYNNNKFISNIKNNISNVIYPQNFMPLDIMSIRTMYSNSNNINSNNINSNNINNNDSIIIRLNDDNILKCINTDNNNNNKTIKIDVSNLTKDLIIIDKRILKIYVDSINSINSVNSINSINSIDDINNKYIEFPTSFLTCQN